MRTGRLHGSHPDRVHNSASVVKVLFMVTLLREPEVRDDDLTDTERDQLDAMITHSDNDAASAIYSRVGEAALYRVAEEAGFDHFTTQPVWGLSTITAGSQARFMYRIERYIPKRHRAFAMRLLTRIVKRQRWGIPPVAPDGWKLYFKGGWSGRPSWRVNQVMQLREGDRAPQPRDPHSRAAVQGIRHALDRGRCQAAVARLRLRLGDTAQQFREDPRGRAPDQVPVHQVGRGTDRNAPSDQSPHRESLAQLIDREGKDGLDLGRARRELEVRRRSGRRTDGP